MTVVGGDAGVVEDARDRLIELITRFDPADPASELSRLNERAGEPVTCSWRRCCSSRCWTTRWPGGCRIDTARSSATVSRRHAL